MTTQFTVPGKPEPQRRGTIVKWGSRPGIKEHPDNAIYADRIRWAWHAAGAHTHADQPVRIAVQAVFPRPKNHWRKNGELSAAGLRSLHYMSAPDGDNIAKAVCDALNGYAFDDDRQVTHLIVSKAWADTPSHSGALHVRIDGYGDESESS